MNELDRRIGLAVRAAVDEGLGHVRMTPTLRSSVLTEAEETPRRRKALLSVALAFVLLLMMAAFGIAATRFGMLDFNWMQQENAAFVEHILSVDEVYENEYMTLTVNDAVFDGVTLIMTMDVQPKPDGGEGVYVYPRMTATVNGDPLEVEIEGCRGDMMSGFWAPERDESIMRLDGTYGADYVLIKENEDGRIAHDPQTEEVTWTLTLDIVKPVYTVKQIAYPLTGEDDYEAYVRQFAEAYERKEILLTGIGSVVDYIYRIPYPEGVERLAWQRTKLSDKLVASGAFERVDTASIVFTTQGTSVKEISGDEVYRIGEYEATLKSLSVTFGRLDYEIHVRRADGGKTAGEEYAAGELDLQFAVLVDGCEAQRSYDACHPLNDNTANPDPVVYYRGGMTLFGEAKSITFVPCFGVQQQRDIYAIQREKALTQEQLAMAFTVEPE